MGPARKRLYGAPVAATPNRWLEIPKTSRYPLDGDSLIDGTRERHSEDAPRVSGAWKRLLLRTFALDAAEEPTLPRRSGLLCLADEVHRPHRTVAHLQTAVVTSQVALAVQPSALGSGLLPRVQPLDYVIRLISPAEPARQPGLPGRHRDRVEATLMRRNRLADELFHAPPTRIIRHSYSSASVPPRLLLRVVRLVASGLRARRRVSNTLRPTTLGTETRRYEHVFRWRGTNQCADRFAWSDQSPTLESVGHPLRRNSGRCGWSGTRRSRSGL